MVLSVAVQPLHHRRSASGKQGRALVRREPAGRPVCALWGIQRPLSLSLLLSPLPCPPHPLPQREEQGFLCNCGPSDSPGLGPGPGPLPFSRAQQFHPLPRFQLVLLPLCAGTVGPGEVPEKASSRGCLRGGASSCTHEHMHSHASRQHERDPTVRTTGNWGSSGREGKRSSGRSFGKTPFLSPGFPRIAAVSWCCASLPPAPGASTLPQTH